MRPYGEVADGVTYKLHLIPSGILSKGKACVIANGAVMTRRALRRRLITLRSAAYRWITSISVTGRI